MIKAGLGVSGRKRRAGRFPASQTGIVGINLVIATTGSKSHSHTRVLRAAIRVAVRNEEKKLINRAFVVGPSLTARHDIVGHTTLNDAWANATSVYCKHLGIRRPVNWIGARKTPKVAQFIDLMHQMTLAGIEFSEQEISLVKAIKRK